MDAIITSMALHPLREWSEPVLGWFVVWLDRVRRRETAEDIRAASTCALHVALQNCHAGESLYVSDLERLSVDRLTAEVEKARENVGAPGSFFDPSLKSLRL